MGSSANNTTGGIVRLLKGKRFGVIGVGNVLKGDDGAGPSVVASLQRRGVRFPLVDASEVPENYGGWVEKRGLEKVVFIDAVDFGGSPGEVRIVPLEDLMISASSTHRLSLHYMITYLKDGWEGEAILIGIQPASLKLGEGLSGEVAAAVEGVACALSGAGA